MLAAGFRTSRDRPWVTVTFGEVELGKVSAADSARLLHEAASLPGTSVPVLCFDTGRTASTSERRGLGSLLPYEVMP